MEQVDNIIARLEAATGADRELDALILLATNTEAAAVTGGVRHSVARCVAPDFTASIDAAILLVDRNALWAIGRMEEGPFARLCWPMPNGGYAGGYQEAKAATAPLALCIAALKARSMSARVDRGE